MLDKKLLGKQIAKLRKEQNMTQKDLASQLHMSFQAISKWERGVSLPDVEMLELLSKKLNTSLWSILYQSNSTMTIEELIEDLNTNKISKHNYINIAVLVQSELLNDRFLSKVLINEVKETLLYVINHIDYFKDLKTIKAAHEIVKVYSSNIDDSFLQFKQETINGINHLYLISDIEYDNVVLYKLITKKIEASKDTVITIFNVKPGSESIYISSTKDLLEKGFSAYTIAQLITSAVTLPNSYPQGGGGVQDRASFSFNTGGTIPNVDQEALRLVREYIINYQSYKVEISSNNK